MRKTIDQAYADYEWYHNNHPIIHSNRFDTLTKKEFESKVNSDEKFAHEWMRIKPKVLVFTGAGVSKESGIDTFRDTNDGLWHKYKIEDVATPRGWKNNREQVLEFYNERRAQLKTVFPNKAHRLIADLEKDFDVTVVTQNVDDLHERAGSMKVIHLHGELTKARGCMYEHKSSPLDSVINIGYDPINIGDKCSVSGSQLRPHIVWFGENLDSDLVGRATKAAHECSVCIVIGTSMQVFPACEIPYQTGERVPIFFVDPSDLDSEFKSYKGEYIKHYKTSATEGMESVVNELHKMYRDE